MGVHIILTFLDTLRTALIQTGFMVAVFSIGGYLLAEPIIRFLQHLTGVKLLTYGLPETFFTFLKLALGSRVSDKKYSDPAA